MNGLQLVAMGGATPGVRVTNDDLRRYVETSDEWIAGRTGIRQRYFCAEGESALTLAKAAARQAVERAGVAPGEIGCCVCATLSNDYATPSMACLVAAELGLPEDLPALDVNAACSGFLYGIAVARGLLAADAKRRRYALVVGCEQLSRLLDMTDRSTCVLFGDGAGAAVLEASGSAPFETILGARGSTAILAEGAGPVASRIQMDGRAVFRFAVDAIPKCIHAVCAQSRLGLEQVDWVVCHQANERILDHCIKKLGVPAEKFYKNMSRFGNTSAASIPMALNEMQENGLLLPGQTVLCVGFGGGLTWAGALLTVKERQE